MDFTQDQVAEFNKHIQRMEKLIRVYNWESCNLIRGYLALDGKMQALEISEKVGLQGDKSVYKSLNRLIDAGLVAKTYEEGSKRNAYYYNTNQLVSDPEFSKEFITYLLEEDKYHLISDYLKAANQGSMGFLQIMTDIMERRISTSNNPSIGEEFIKNTMFIETIMSVPNPRPFLDRLSEFMMSELQQYIHDNPNPEEGTPHPAAFFLAFVPLDQPSKSKLINYD